MGNNREIRQLTPRKGLGVVVPVRPGHSADVDRVLSNPSERYRFYTSLYNAGEPICFSNLVGPDVKLHAQPFDCVTMQSGGAMFCGYEMFVSKMRELAPCLTDTLYYTLQDLCFLYTIFFLVVSQML